MTMKKENEYSMRMIREKVLRRALWAIFGCRWRSGPPTSDMTSDWVVINTVAVVGQDDVAVGQDDVEHGGQDVDDG